MTLLLVLYLSATSPRRNHVLPSPEPQFYLLTRGFNWEVEYNMKVAQPLLNAEGTPISDASISEEGLRLKSTYKRMFQSCKVGEIKSGTI